MFHLTDDLRAAVVTGLSLHSVLIVVIFVLLIIILKKLHMIPSWRASRQFFFSVFNRKTSENHSRSCPHDNKELDFNERQHHNYPQDYNDGQDYDDRQDYNDRQGHRESQEKSTTEAIYGNYLNGGVLSRDHLQPEDTSPNGPNLAGPSDTATSDQDHRYYNYVPPDSSPHASAQHSPSPDPLYFVLEHETGSDVERTAAQDDHPEAKLYGNIKVKQAKHNKNKNKKVNKHLGAETETEPQYANSHSADGDLSMGRVGNAQPQQYHRIVFNGKDQSAFDVREADDDTSNVYSKVRSKAPHSPIPGRSANALTEAL